MASQDDDKVMAGLLRRTLASSAKSGSAGGAGDCPTADILAAYYEHSLGADESVHYDLHFSQCAPCREQFAAMARAEDVPQPAPRAGWAWLWNPFFLAPAMAVLALAIFFGVKLNRPVREAAIPPSQPESAPLVAMSRTDQAPHQEAAAPPPPSAAAGNASSNELKKAPLDSVERDALAQEKQSQLKEPLTPQSAPLADSERSASPAAPSVADKKAQDLPLNGRDLPQSQALRKAETAQKDAEAPQISTQSVVVTAAAPPVQTAQNLATPQNAPAPFASGGAAGAAGSSDEIIRESAGRSQAKAPAAISSFAGIAKSQAPQAAAEISTHKVIQTPNTNVLWRSADGGFVERSADGGATWAGQQLPGAGGEIAAGSSPTTKICWLVGSGGTIYMTKDATNWAKIAAPASADFTAVTAKDASNVTVTAADGRQFQTTDGGKHWKALP